MSIKIELLTPDLEASYEELLHSVEYSLMYVSLKYRNFLKRILTHSQDFYLVAYESGQMVGVLPSFIKYNTTYGNILNSLPFYGSNGGVILSPKASDRKAVKLALLGAFDSLGVEKSVMTSTLISNPLDPDVTLYEAHSQYTLRDRRIGQIVCLPTRGSNDSELEDALMGMFHQKTRNCVRKAQKNQIAVYHSDSLEAIQSLATLHQQNLEVIGGLSKSWSVFLSIRETFSYDRDYRVYLAQKDGRIIAALLVFFYNHTAEYYTPATLVKYRVYQPMSLLVYEAMKEATQRGCIYWNWGGTWLTQDGVYHFKSRWGTEDKLYSYYIKVFDEQILGYSKEQLLQEYPYFYAVPFAHLKSEK